MASRRSKAAALGGHRARQNRFAKDRKVYPDGRVQSGLLAGTAALVALMLRRHQNRGSR